MVIKNKKLIEYLETDLESNLYKLGEFLLPSLKTLLDTEHFKVTRVWVEHSSDDIYIISYGWKSTFEPDMGHKTSHIIYTQNKHLQILGLSEQYKEYWKWLKRNYKHFVKEGLEIREKYHFDPDFVKNWKKRFKKKK